MLIVISGPSCVGKSFCIDDLCANRAFKTAVPYTTRPPRISEAEGAHYHFRSEVDLRNISGNFASGYWDQPLGDRHWYGYTAEIDSFIDVPQVFVIQASTTNALSIRARHRGVPLVFLDFQTDSCFERRMRERFSGAELASRRIHASRERQRADQFTHLLRNDNPIALSAQLYATIVSLYGSSMPVSTIPSTGPLTDRDILASLVSRDGLRITTAAGISIIELKKQIHGWSIDLTLGERFHVVPRRLFRRYFGRDFFDLAFANQGVIDARFPERTCGDIRKGLILREREFVLASTRESLTLPNDLVAIFSGRSSYASIGLSVELSQIILQPGHTGPVRLQLRNNLPYPIRIYPGTPLVQVVFFRTGTAVSEDYSAQQSAKYHDADQRSRFYKDPFYAEIRTALEGATPKNWAEPWEKLTGAVLIVITAVVAVLPESKIQHYGSRGFFIASALAAFFLLARYFYRSKE